MNPQQLLNILKARYKIALLVFVLTAAVAAVVIVQLPKQFTASTTLSVDIRAPDPISAMIMPTSIATQEELIKSDRVAQRAVKILNIEENATARTRWREATGGRGRMDVWMAELLRKKLSVSAARRDSNIINIEYTAVDPGFAASVANAFAQAYIETAVEMKVEPAKQYARWFEQQGLSLRENMERAQSRLSDFQQQKGLVARDETVDAETAKLTELMSRPTTVQAQTSDARSKQRSGASNLPEVMQSSVVVSLRGDIARQEAKLKEVAGNFGPNHPQYRRMESELAELKNRLAVESRLVASGFTASTSVGRDNENDLKAAIEAQKKKLLQLKDLRDQLAVLQRDVDAAKNAYDVVVKRYTETNLQSQATQTNVFLLNPAFEPLEPSSPNFPRLSMMAAFFGLMLGLAAAFGVELLDRRVRCVADLEEMLQMPVLTVIPHSRARRGRMARLLGWRTQAALPGA